MGMIMKWIFAVVFWVAWFGSVFLPVRGQNTFNNLAVKTNLAIKGEQFTNIVITPAMFGTSDAATRIQEILDTAPDGGHVVITPGTYEMSNGVFIKRHNLTLTGHGAVLKAMNDLPFGTLVGVVNATNVTVRGLTLDLDGQMDNGITVIGNTGESNSGSLVGSNYCTGIVIDGIKVHRARFGINRIEGQNVGGTPAFQVGELVRLNYEEKYLTATVLTNNSPSGVVMVRYTTDRFPTGVSMEGITSGQVATINSRYTSTNLFPNGVEYVSMHGPFGGKGISIQYGTRGVTVSNCQTYDCDTGISIEGRESFLGENTGTVVTGCLFKDSGRTGIWLLCADAPQYSSEVYSVIISGCRIHNWGHTFGGFGAVTADRAQFVRMTGVLATQDPDYVPASASVPWVGTVANSHIDITAQVGQAGGMLDFRRHPPWGNAPGFLTLGSSNNVVTVKMINSSIAPVQTWVNSAGTFSVTNFAINWESSPASGLLHSTVTAYANGWTNTFWFGRNNSSVRYMITDQKTNSIVSLGDASNQAAFSSTYRVVYNGVGSAPGRAAVKFNDTIEASSLYKWGNNQGEIGWDDANSRGYLRPRSGTFRVQNTAGEEILQLASRGITTPSASFNGKTLLLGAWQLWVDPVTSGLRMKNTAPASATDGVYVIPLRGGTAVLGGGTGTATVALSTVTATSNIQLTCQIPGGTPGFLRVSARVFGASFTIQSSDAADTSTVGYMILEP